MNLADLLRVRLPIVQAPMAGVQDDALAAAACEAGALGSLPCAMLGVDAMREQLSRLRARTTAPINVNFFCHEPPPPDPAREAAWRARLAPYYAEFGIDPATIAPSAGRRPFDAAVADVLADFRPEVVSFQFGLPAPALLARVRAWGAVVMSSATTVDEARWLEAHGVDVVIAQGLEAGGHRGMFLGDDLATQTGTLALVAAVTRAVRVPVLAAGGIATAQDVADARAAGAAGVQVGTAFLCCPEATTSAVHRAALASPAARQTALTRLFSGRPARGIVNRLMRDLGPMSDAAPAFPLASAALAPLRARAEAAGSGDFSPLWAGTRAEACRREPAADVLRALAAGL